MKAEELMIGDWVLAKESSFSDKLIPVRIELVNAFGYVELDDGSGEIPSNVTEIQPIPLTPEILEKNEFAKIDENTFEIWQGQDVGESIYVKTDMQIIAYKPCYSMVCETMPLHYLHELQHILRILKIKKEIRL